MKMFGTGNFQVYTQSDNSTDLVPRNSVQILINAPNDSTKANFIFNSPVNVAAVKTNTLQSQYDWVGATALTMNYSTVHQTGTDFKIQSNSNKSLRFQTDNETDQFVIQQSGTVFSVQSDDYISIVSNNH